MCGRMDIHTPPAQLARRLGVPLAKDVDPEGDPSWNIAPSRGVPVVIERASPGADGTQGIEGPYLYVFHWGLLPYWAKTPTVGYKMINAKAETLATSAAYRIPFRQRRCLVVADGFYEWHPSESGKLKRTTPYYFWRADGAPLTFAGLYQTWWDKSRSEEPDPETILRTCTIVTTDAGPDVADIHDRMPVVLEEKDRDAWLDPWSHDTAALSKLLVPAPRGTLGRREVSTAVSSPQNDGPELIKESIAAAFH